MAKKKKAFKFRIYPNQTQKDMIDKTCGCSRFVFNYFLDSWNKEYEKTQKGLTYVKCATELTKLKKEEKYAFLKEVDSIALQSSLKNLEMAFKRFFKQQNRKPRFKSRKNPVQSYTTKMVNNNIEILDNKIKLPKLGKIKFKKSREVVGRIMSATISKTSTEKYFVSILCEVEMYALPKTNQTIGLDLGLNHFVITSNGEKINNPRYLENNLKKLKKLSKQLSRKREVAMKAKIDLANAKNYQKQKKKLAKLYEKIRNQRMDFLHKLSTKLVLENDIICIEDLNVKGLMKNHKLARAIASVGWSEFVRMLEYKAKFYGRKIVKVDRFYPSSQICSNCGKNTGKKPLNIREFTCEYCGCVHDRNINASKNILNKGLEMS